MSVVGGDLQPGDRVDLEIVEILPAGQLICSLEGRLFRVTNQSPEKPKVGDRVRLFVSSRNPLEFRWSPGPGLNRRI